MAMTSLKLRDFSEPARLLFRYRRYEVVTRQQAASPVRDILTITSELVDLPAIETRLALYLWERLTPPETQQALKRIGRLYKNSCWWSKKGPRRLFDKAWASSGKKLSLTAQSQARTPLDPADADLIAKREVQQIRREGGRVIYLGDPAERHANLARTRADYNGKWGSYWSDARVGRTLRALGSLNIPRERIEVRNNMIANLERDFGLRDEEVVA